MKNFPAFCLLTMLLLLSCGMAETTSLADVDEYPQSAESITMENEYLYDSYPINKSLNVKKDLVKDRLTLERIREEKSDLEDKDRKLKSDLSPFFYYSTTDVEDYIQKIKKMSNRQITEHTSNLIKERIIVDTACKRKMWKILHEANLYTVLEATWNKQIVL